MIEAVGAGVDQALVGEPVWLWDAAWQRPWGTAAEYTVVPVRQAVRLGSAPFELGASLGIPFLTAHRCLTVGETMPDQLASGGAGRPHGAGARRGGRGRQRGDPARGLVGRPGDGDGEQPGEGAAGGATPAPAW